MAGDKVVLTVESTNGMSSFLVRGVVMNVSESKVDLSLSSPMRPDAKYTMHFALNRLNYRLERFAIHLLQDLNLIPFLFPENNRFQFSNQVQNNLVYDQ